MKHVVFACLILLIASSIAGAQDPAFRRPNLIGSWKVVESWDVTVSDRLEITRTEVLTGFDNRWIFKDNQELLMVDPLHMVDPIRKTYVYHWRWLNDTTVCVVPASKGIFLLCHLLDYSPSRLVFISSVAEDDPQHESPSLCVLRVLQKTD